MKLDLLDTYNIRARLCPSIILLGPIALTIFFCFEKIYTFTSSAISICILLAFTNYIPILQRTLNKNRTYKTIPSSQGGIEIVVEELTVRMAKLGHKITVW